MPLSDDIRAAAALLRGFASPTPVVLSDSFGRACGAEVHLKLECLQKTGSFKVRGAFCRIARHRDRIGPLGVIAASAGNHAQGVALAASHLGLRATVVMPETSALSKQLATRGYGAEVLLHGASVADALAHAQTLAAEGYFFVHPFDDPDVIAGQGTVGLEILEAVPDVDEVWVPVGGGGLVAGVAAAVKESRPGARVVGVQAAACPAAVAARGAGEPLTVEPCGTIADGIAVNRVGERPFELIQRHVDDLVTVGDDEIAAAVLYLLERKKVLAEGAGAAPLAALVGADTARLRGRKIVLVVSGGNLDLNLLDRILERGLIRTGRMLRCRVLLRDVPGALEALLRVFSGQRANVLRIHHDRLAHDVPIGSTRVEVWVETRNFEHVNALCGALAAAGFPNADEETGD